MGTLCSCASHTRHDNRRRSLTRDSNKIIDGVHAFDLLPNVELIESPYGVFTRHKLDCFLDPRIFLVFRPHTFETGNAAVYFFHDTDRTCVSNRFLGEEAQLLLKSACGTGCLLVFAQSLLWRNNDNQIRTQWTENLQETMYVEALAEGVENLYHSDHHLRYAVGFGDGASFLNYCCHALEGWFQSIVDICGGVVEEIITDEWKLNRKTMRKKLSKLTRAHRRLIQSDAFRMISEDLHFSEMHEWRTKVMTITTPDDPRLLSSFRAHLGLAALGMTATLRMYNQNEINVSSFIDEIIEELNEKNGCLRPCVTPLLDVISRNSILDLKRLSVTSTGSMDFDWLHGDIDLESEMLGDLSERLDPFRSSVSSATQSRRDSVISADSESFFSDQFLAVQRTSISAPSRRSSIISAMTDDFSGCGLSDTESRRGSRRQSQIGAQIFVSLTSPDLRSCNLIPDGYLPESKELKPHIKSIKCGPRTLMGETSFREKKRSPEWSVRIKTETKDDKKNTDKRFLDGTKALKPKN